MDPVVHFEIPFDEKDRALTFYRNTFGWQLHDMPDMGYVVVHTTEVDHNYTPKKTGRINGGMMKKTDPITSPVIVIKVKNLDDKIKQVTQNGGSVVKQKGPVGDMGYYAQVKDTEGNIIGIWEDR